MEPRGDPSPGPDAITEEVRPDAAAVAPTADASPDRAARAAPAALPKIGALVAGYRLERLIGRGGMGAVYLGVNEVGAERAIKVSLAAAGADDARVGLEAQALAK